VNRANGKDLGPTPTEKISSEEDEEEDEKEDREEDEEEDEEESSDSDDDLFSKPKYKVGSLVKDHRNRAAKITSYRHGLYTVKYTRTGKVGKDMKASHFKSVVSDYVDVGAVGSQNIVLGKRRVTNK